MQMENGQVKHWATDYAPLLADHCAQGILLADNAFQIAHANARAAAILGAPCSDSLAGIHLANSKGEARIWFDRPFVTKNELTPRDGQYTACSEFGPDVPVELKFLQPARDTHLILVTDLTMQVDLERTVLQAEKLAAMDNIVAGIAHELNNPMTAILGYAELLLATEKDPKRKQRVALIAEEADRCGKIIASMLTYTRSYGKAMETACVNDVLNEVLTLQSYQLRVDGIDLHSSYDQEVPPSQLLTSGLRRLFLNLLHNAHQALLEVPPGNRHLWTTTELREDTICIQISDSGPGIPKSNLLRIFDPFFTTRPLGEGMGLGLSVAFGVVHEHGGKIWAEPRPGGGATLNVEIPLRFQAP